MNTAEEFEAEVAVRPHLVRLVEFLEPTEYGCSYTWDGYMPCYIVHEGGWYYDVQAVDNIKAVNLEDFLRYDSILNLVLAMEVLYI